MTVQLYSIEHGPVSLPIWHTIMEDLCNPPPARVARVLGISRRTVYRYNQTGHAPRVALLALYWLTRWGRHSVHCQATNDALVAVSYVESLRREVARLEANVRHLSQLNHGAANEPLIRGPHGR